MKKASQVSAPAPKSTAQGNRPKSKVKKLTKKAAKNDKLEQSSVLGDKVNNLSTSEILYY